MRNAFADELTRLASADDRIVLLSGDIGNRLFNRFKDICGARFFNCGVAEQNMAGVAAGMAMSGLRPVTYTITPFNTSRCFEQIKLDICYQNQPVVIVGVGSGLSYASLGATHQSFEDIGILRTLPNLKIVCPADAIELRVALRAALQEDGPIYLRIGKKNEPVIYDKEPAFEIGRSNIIRTGNDVCLLGVGNMVAEAIEAAVILEGKNISAKVVDMHTVKPLDIEMLDDVFGSFDVVCSVEEHSIIGGLGSAVAEWSAEQRALKAKFKRLGIPDRFLGRLGGQADGRSSAGIDAESIAKSVSNMVEGVK